MIVGWDFARELVRHGPSRPSTAIQGSEARRYCQYVARTHYENFTVASLLLPRSLRPHFHVVYAWCRWADDLGDETGPDAAPLLDWWRHELEACYAGTPRHPVTIALQETVRLFRIPKQLFLDLISAFEQDQTVKDYRTFAEILDYCRRSANPVGRIVLHLFECHDEARGHLSDAICTGLQLANFWQDVARDYAIGRIYIPREDRERFGYADQDFANHRFNDAFRALLEYEVQRTKTMFLKGRALVPLLPRSARIEVSLFLGGGLAVLDAIAAQDYDVWQRRPRITKWTKAKLLASALLSGSRPRPPGL